MRTVFGPRCPTCGHRHWLAEPLAIHVPRRDGFWPLARHRHCIKCGARMRVRGAMLPAVGLLVFVIASFFGAGRWVTASLGEGWWAAIAVAWLAGVLFLATRVRGEPVEEGE